jgi:hypothetical protein
MPNAFTSARRPILNNHTDKASEMPRRHVGASFAFSASISSLSRKSILKYNTTAPAGSRALLVSTATVDPPVRVVGVAAHQERAACR